MDRFLWGLDHDKALVKFAREGKSQLQIAKRLSDLFGVEFTRTSVKMRLSRLRGEGIDLPPLPMGGAADRADRIDRLRKTVNDPDLSSDPKASIDDPQDALVTQLVRLTRKKTIPFEDVCDTLGLSPRNTREIIGLAQTRGYRIDVDGDHVGAKPADTPLDEQLVTVDQAGKFQYLAAVGDIHFGSKHHLREQFQDFCRIAYRRGVRRFLHVGDLLDGVYPHSVWEQSARGFEEQVAVAIEQLPQWPDATWHFIQGNHDETLGMQSGLDVGRAIEQAFRAAGRTDVIYHGARRAYLRLKAPDERRGLLVELWHPRDKSNAYAKSYRLQKHVEGYAPGQKPDVLLAGHWHQCIYLPIRGVHCLSTGCWQGAQSAFGKSLSGSPDIGSWIVRYAQTEGGTIRRFGLDWVSYMEVEQIREVGLG